MYGAAYHKFADGNTFQIVMSSVHGIAASSNRNLNGTDFLNFYYSFLNCVKTSGIVSKLIQNGATTPHFIGSWQVNKSPSLPH